MTTSIIIPCHNEEGNIGALLESLSELGKDNNIDMEIVVVDDNSSDRTSEIAKEMKKKNGNIILVHRSKGMNGMGFALREGTKQSKGNYIVWVMGDRSDDMSTIPLIISKLENGHDMVFGSRYMKGASRGDLPLFKAMLSSGFTAVSRLIFGVPVHDITNAFRGFKREVFDSVDLEAGNFAISPEFAIKAHRKGFKLGEVPTVYTDRTKGKSSFGLLNMGASYSKLLLLRFKK